MIGHRAARGEALENSLAAFQLALGLPVDGIECDVVLTADGKLAVFHDTEVPGPAGPTGVETLTLEQMRRQLAQADERYAAAGAVPELGEVLDLFLATPGVRLDLEVKTPKVPGILTLRRTNRMLALVCAEIDAAGMTSRTSLLSFEPYVLRRIRRIRPDLPTVLNYSRTSTPARVRGPFGIPRSSSPLDLAIVLSVVRIQPEWALVDRKLVSSAHSLGFEVVPWVVNTQEEIEQALALGVDGICTDVPAFALQVRAQHADG